MRGNSHVRWAVGGKLGDNFKQLPITISGLRRQMNTISRFSMLALTGFAFPAPVNFILSSFARTVTTMIANSVRNMKIILRKLGKFSIIAAKLFAFVKVVLTNIIGSVSTAMNIIRGIRLLLPVMVPVLARNVSKMIMPSVINAMNIFGATSFQRS